jgi:hypothetical protein
MIFVTYYLLDGYTLHRTKQPGQPTIKAVLKKLLFLSLRATEDTRVAGSAAISYAKSAEELRSPRPRETRGLAMTQTPTSSTDPKWWAAGLKIRLDG